MTGEIRREGSNWRLVVERELERIELVIDERKEVPKEVFGEHLFKLALSTMAFAMYSGSERVSFWVGKDSEGIKLFRLGDLQWREDSLFSMPPNLLPILSIFMEAGGGAG